MICYNCVEAVRRRTKFKQLPCPWSKRKIHFLIIRSPRLLVRRNLLFFIAKKTPFLHVQALRSKSGRTLLITVTQLSPMPGHVRISLLLTLLRRASFLIHHSYQIPASSRNHLALSGFRLETMPFLPPTSVAIHFLLRGCSKPLLFPSDPQCILRAQFSRNPFSPFQQDNLLFRSSKVFISETWRVRSRITGDFATVSNTEALDPFLHAPALVTHLEHPVSQKLCNRIFVDRILLQLTIDLLLI